MGVVDRNAPVVLDLEAIWMICSRLDISMNHRSPATATFKAQLVTETPAIEMEKKCVFEQDRSFETLDQFLGFEKIAVAIGTSGPIGSPMSIMCPVKLEAQKDCLSFGETSPMAPPSRCSFGLQSRSSAVDVQGFNRAMQVVFHTTGAVSGRLTSGSAPGLDSNANMKAGDFGALPDVGLCVLRARLECRNFLEVPRVRKSCMLPILLKAGRSSEVFRKNVRMTPLAARCSFGLQSRSSAVDVQGFNRAMQVVFHTTGAVSGAVRLAGRLTSGSAPGLDSNATMKAGDFGSLLAELAADVAVPRVRQSCMLPILLKAGQSSGAFRKKFRMTPPAARCSFMLQNSSAVDGKGLNQVSQKNSSMTLHASRCSFALQNSSRAVERTYFNRAMQVVFHTTGAISGRLTRATGFDKNVTMKAGDFGSLLAELALDVLRARLKCRKCRNSSEVPRVCTSYWVPKKQEVMEKGDWKQLCRPEKQMVSVTRGLEFSAEVCVGPCFRSFRSFHEAGAIGLLLARKPFKSWGAELELSRDFFEACKLFGAWLLGLRDNRSEPATILYPNGMALISSKEVKGNWKQPFSAKQAGRSSEAFRKSFRMTPPAARCSFGLQSRSSAVHVQGFNRAMQVVFRTTGADSGLDSNATMKAMDPSPEQWKYDADTPLQSPRSLCAVPTNMKYKPVYLCCHGFARWVRVARNPSESSWKNSSVTLPASRCSFALQNRSRAGERAGFNRAMQVVFRSTGAVSGLDSNGTMETMEVDEDKCAKCPSYLNGAANVREAGDSGALLPDLGLCVFRARLQRRHFSEVPRVRQSCMLLKAQKRVAPLRRFEFGVAWTARCYGWCLQFQATLPRPVKQAVVPALDRDIWMRTSMSIRCSFVVVQKEEPEDILQATDSMFRPMSWSRRLKALDSLESDSQLCGPPHGARHDPLHLNDVWTPLKHAESAEPSENLSCQVPMHTDLAIEEDVHKEKVELRKGCRLLTVQSRELYPLSAGSTARTPRTRTTRTKRRKEVLCDVAEKTGAANAKLVAFSGALRSGRTDASVAGNDLAGWTHDGFSQLDLGDKLALQNPFESVLIETGALLQECEPEELIMLTVSHGGNSAYRLASNIERATGRAVRGVVMWDFLSAFGRGIQGPPLNTTEAVLMKVEGHTMLSASPAFRCRCEHPIQMVAGHKTGELAMDLLMDRTRAESAVKVMYKELQIQKVQECHFGFERTNWDMLRLILSARPPKNTTDAAEGDIGAA